MGLDVRSRGIKQSTMSSALRPFSGDFTDRASYEFELPSNEFRTAKREIRLLHAEGKGSWWLEAVVRTGMAICFVSGPVMIAMRVWAIGLLALIGFGAIMLGQRGIETQRRRYLEEPASRKTTALILTELPDAIAARVIDKHRSWRTFRAGDPERCPAQFVDQGGTRRA